MAPGDADKCGRPQGQLFERSTCCACCGRLDAQEELIQHDYHTHVRGHPTASSHTRHRTPLPSACILVQILMMSVALGSSVRCLPATQALPQVPATTAAADGAGHSPRQRLGRLAQQRQPQGGRVTRVTHLGCAAVTQLTSSSRWRRGRQHDGWRAAVAGGESDGVDAAAVAHLGCTGGRHRAAGQQWAQPCRTGG
jgi:hypothetical protein